MERRRSKKKKKNGGGKAVNTEVLAISMKIAGFTTTRSYLMCCKCVMAH